MSEAVLDMLKRTVPFPTISSTQQWYYNVRDKQLYHRDGTVLTPAHQEAFWGKVVKKKLGKEPRPTVSVKIDGYRGS